MPYDFKPIRYRDLERGYFVEFNYPNIIGSFENFRGFVDEVNPLRLRLSMSEPDNTNESLINRLLRTKLYKDFEMEKIKELKRLEVVLEEDSDIPF